MSSGRERLVPLTDDLPESPGFPLHTCNYCAGRGTEGVKADVALEFQGKKTHRYYGMCANDAEVRDISFNWQDRG